MSASCYLFSLGRDGLLPPVFSRQNARFQTPHNAVLFTGTCVIAALFVELEVLVKAASTVLILTNLLANACLIVLRESRLSNYQPRFRAPLYPMLQIAGILGYLIVLLEMGAQALVTSAVLILGGILFYVFCGRVRTRREYALLHLVERISDRELTRGFLESELKEIIRSRDELCFDRFDRVVEAAPFLDLEDGPAPEDAFLRIGQEVQHRHGLDPAHVRDTMLEREARGSTLLFPGHAVLDLVVKGTQIFDMLVVRSRDGISLQPGQVPVRALFLLILSEDQRDFYLQTVASIAQVMQDQAFDKRWLEARNGQQLKDLLLLVERRRVCAIA